MLATASKKLAMIALVPFMYSIFQHEMRILIEGKKSTFKAIIASFLLAVASIDSAETMKSTGL
jgi:hypothetical protein